MADVESPLPGSRALQRKVSAANWEPFYRSQQPLRPGELAP